MRLRKARFRWPWVRRKRYEDARRDAVHRARVLHKLATLSDGELLLEWSTTQGSLRRSGGRLPTSEQVRREIALEGL